MTGLTGAVEEYLNKDRSRFHMPGHKGAPLPVLGDVARWDITEVDGADSLYHANGPILETEREYARLYGSAASLLCAGGSTLCVQAMLALAPGPGGRLLIGRGAHTAAVNAMALLDIDPVWIWPDQDEKTGLALPVTPERTELALRENPGAGAVYITSPDYFGAISDIAAISAICGKYGLPLLVDNAHGAHLAFLEPSIHPVALGAALCCDSLHKTLPVLTGGAILHIGDRAYLPRARRMMSMFGSTSPSYLVMLSADGALSYLENGFRSDLTWVIGELAELRKDAAERGLLVVDSGLIDPIRLTIGAGPLGYNGAELATHLRGCRVEPEYAGDRFCVLMASGFNTRRDFTRLREAIHALPDRHRPLPPDPPPLISPQRVLSPRQASFAPSARVRAEEATGRICAAAVTLCPPGIPLVMPGEMIDSRFAALLKNYGILHCDVIE